VNSTRPNELRAYQTAERLHDGQYRKTTGEPYITHPEAVADLVRANGGDKETITAAYLHDVLEDAPDLYSKDTMIKDFGPNVTELVEYVSEEKVDENGVEYPWRHRKQAYITKISDAPNKAKLISLADKVHNLSSILDTHKYKGDVVWENFKAPVHEQFWYYSTLNEIFISSFGADFPLVRQLTEDCRQLHQILGQQQA